MFQYRPFLTPFWITLFVLLTAVACAPDNSVRMSSMSGAASSDSSAPIVQLGDDDYDLVSAEVAVEFAAGEAEDPYAAARWFWEQRASGGTIPVAQHKALAQAELNNPDRFSGTRGGWEELGPNPLNDITFAGQSQQDASGRVLTIAIHPTDTDIILIGAAQGGIWRSTDGGSSYSSVSDNMPSLAIKAIRFAKSDPSIVYAATGEPHASTSIYGRGVLKSTNGGVSWSQLPVSGAGWDFDNVSVAGLQVSSTNPNVLYVATAHVRTFIDSFQPESIPATGLYKSTNGGTSWTLSKAATDYVAHPGTSEENVGFIDLEMAGNNPNLLYAAELNGGIWKTTNGGSNWTRITPIKAGGSATFPAPVPHYTIADQTTLAVSRHDATFFNDAPDFMRIELGLSPSNPNVLYAGVAVSELPVDSGDDGSFASRIATGLLFKTTNGGTSWTWLGDVLDGVPNYCSSQCDYDNMVVVNPTNPNDVIIGGSANYSQFTPVPLNAPTTYVEKGWTGMVHRSTNGGTSWQDTNPHCTANGPASGAFNIQPCLNYAANQVIHPDIHDAAYRGNQLYIVGDGGVYRGSPAGGGFNWENLNAGLSTLQFYAFDIHPTNPNIMIGGLQDNSVAYWDGNTWEGWAFGDGIFGAIDPVNPNNVYMGTQFNVWRHQGGGAKQILVNDQIGNGWSNVFPPAGVQAQFVTPFAIDSVQSSYIYAGATDAVYESAQRGDTGTWVRRVNTGLSSTGVPTTISISEPNNSLIWAGTSGGALHLYTYEEDQDFWFSGGGVLPARYLSKVEASPNDADSVYFTYSGYSSNTPATPGKVFKLTKGSAGWGNVSISFLTGDLPDVPVSAFAVNPNNENIIWVGTDIGVFMTTNGGTNWTSIRGQMPVVAIMDMKYDAARDTLWVVTHGRGAWRTTVASVPTAVTFDSISSNLPQLGGVFAITALMLVGTATAIVRRRKIDG